MSDIVPAGRYVPAKVDGLKGIAHTIDTTSYAGKAKLMQASSPGELEIPEDGPLRMVLTDFAAFWDTGVDEMTGEIQEYVRSVFYDDDGQTFRTTSRHAPHFFAMCVDVYGLERIKEGLPIKISERKSRREKRVYHDFHVDIEE